MSYAVARLDEIEEMNDGRVPWRPLRHHLGITAFGVNTFTAPNAGDRLINEHDETGDNDGHEELYVVLSGTATFTVDDETFDAPQGTLVLVTPPSRRVAHASEPDTTVLAVGAPGKSFSVSEWETRWLRSGSG